MEATQTDVKHETPRPLFGQSVKEADLQLSLLGRFKRFVHDIILFENGDFLFLIDNEVYRGNTTRTFYEYFPAFGNVTEYHHLSDDFIGLIKKREFLVVELPSMTVKFTLRVDSDIVEVDNNTHDFVIVTEDGYLHWFVEHANDIKCNQKIKLPFPVDDVFELEVCDSGIIVSSGYEVLHVKLQE